MSQRLILLILINLFTFNLIFSQTSKLNASINSLKKYKEIEILNYSYGKKSHWSQRVFLENGRIRRVNHFNKSKLISTDDYYYENKKFKIKKFSLIKEEIGDTINFSYCITAKGELIEYNTVIEEYFSDYNTLKLPETITSGTTSFDSLIGFKTKLEYDIKSNIIKEKVYSKIDNKIITNTTQFIYDEFNNVIELNREASYKIEYPSIILGGLPHYKNEKFEYVYNEDNIWIKKYWIVNNKKYLYQKRKFRK